MQKNSNSNKVGLERRGPASRNINMGKTSVKWDKKWQLKILDDDFQPQHNEMVL